jgi:hypothetical protein
MKCPVVELVDRYTIAIVKHERTHGANQAEYDFYHNEMQELDIEMLKPHLRQLIDIHQRIWDLEDDFKKYQESTHSLEEVGRRSLVIRDLNHERVKLKNQIAQYTACAVREIKQDHVSEIIRPR